jgi:hypothetical protein
LFYFAIHQLYLVSFLICYEFSNTSRKNTPRATRHAIIIKQRGQAVVRTIPIPRVPDTFTLVKTGAVGLEPVDASNSTVTAS